MYFQQYSGVPQQGAAGYTQQGAAGFTQQQLQQQQQQLQQQAQQQPAFNSFQQPAAAQTFQQQNQAYGQAASVYPQAYAAQSAQSYQQPAASNFTSLASPFQQPQAAAAATPAAAYPSYYNPSTATATPAITSATSRAFATPAKPTPLPTPTAQLQTPTTFNQFKPLATQSAQVLQAQQMLALKAQQAQQQLQQQQLQQQQQLFNAQRQALAAQSSRSSSSSSSRSSDSKRDRPPREIDRRPPLPPRPRRERRRYLSPPPKRESSVLPTGEIGEKERKYKQLKSRYPNMYIPTDFSYLDNTWVHTIKSTGPAPRPYFVTHEAVDFEVSNTKPEDPAKSDKAADKTDKADKPADEPAAAPAATPAPAPAPVDSFSPTGRRYNVRVALVNGIPPEDLINTSLPHLCRQLKVIVQEKKETESSKYLSLVGGMWTAEDGGNPDVDLTALIRTAVRTTKEFLGINLQHVMKWSVLGKINYARPQEERHGKVIPKHDDVTVILLPLLAHWDPAGITIEQPEQVQETDETTSTETAGDASKAADDKDKDGKDKEKEKESEEKDKEKEKKNFTPGVIHREGEGLLVRVVATSDKVKARFLSLDGLLDYRPKDTMERTFEVSVCAEMMKELLQRDFGETIYHALYAMPEKKKEKEKKEEPKDKKRERDRDAEEVANTKDDKKEDEEKKEKEESETFPILMLPTLFAAYRFFDRGDKGFVLNHDLEDLIHALGHKYSQKQVRSLVDKVSHSASGRIYYKDQTHIEVKEGDPRTAPDIIYSDPDETDPMAPAPVDEPTGPVMPNETGGNFVDSNILLNRLEKSENARRQAVHDAHRANEELHKIRDILEDKERQYGELSTAAHKNDNFLASKIQGRTNKKYQEAERLKNLVMVIKAAMNQAENDNLAKKEAAAAKEKEKETKKEGDAMDVEVPNSKKQKTETA
eukprot:Phypoly_transcript_02304.p1 GENE.Phypoly_transcript_02304~~Phypoly_transcript_02304.p1  ORF type:complete len:932 (+),score=245.88 Phypoly_transcript_02304:56-2851(+)